jgi:hypothetical protein
MRSLLFGNLVAQICNEEGIFAMTPRSSSFANSFGWLNRLQPPEGAILGGAALMVGLTSAIGVWLFKLLIDLFHTGAFDFFGGGLGTYGTWLIFLVPVVGGLSVGLLLHFFVGEERHHGVAGIMEAVARWGGSFHWHRRVSRPRRSFGPDWGESGFSAWANAAPIRGSCPHTCCCRGRGRYRRSF